MTRPPLTLAPNPSPHPNLHPDREPHHPHRRWQVALLARAFALSEPLHIEAPAVGGGGAEEAAAKEKLHEAVGEMKLWVSGPDTFKEEEDKACLALCLARHEVSRERPGAALKTLRAALAASTPSSKRYKEVAKETVALYKDMGFGHWASNAEEALLEAFPPMKLPL